MQDGKSFANLLDRNATGWDSIVGLEKWVSVARQCIHALTVVRPSMNDVLLHLAAVLHNSEGLLVVDPIDK